MKKKDLGAIRTKSIKNLKALISKTETELVKSETDFAAGKIKSRRVTNQKRREIAQLKTILKEKELIEPNEVR